MFATNGMQVSERPPLVGRGLLVFLLVWPVLWSNGKIADVSDPGRFVTLPTQLRFIEPVVLAAVIAFAVLFGRPQVDRFLRATIVALAVVCVAGVVGSSLAFPGVVNALYGTYDVTVAFVLVIAVLVLDYNRQELAIVSAYFFLLCFVNWFVGVDQAVVMGVQADRIHGLYDDANTMSTIFYVVSGYCLYRYAIARTVPHLLYGLFLIPMAYLGFNEKLNLFFLGLMLPLILFRLTRNPMHMLFAAIVGIALLSLTLGFAERSGLTGRTSTVSDLVRGRGGFGALGVIRSWPLAWEQISDHPATLLFGSGASNFGGAVAANRFNNGTATSITNEVFQFQTSAEYLGAFDSPTNYFTNVLAEFGLVGFLAIVGLLGFILRRLHTLGKKHRNPDLVAAAWAAKWGWVIVGMQALFVPFGAFGNLAVMVPIALATAVVVVEGRHLDRTSSDSAFTA